MKQSVAKSSDLILSQSYLIRKRKKIQMLLSSSVTSR